MSTYSGVAALPSRTLQTLPDDRFTLLGDLTGFEVRGATLILDAGGPRLAVTVLADDVLRVRLAPTGDFRTAGHGADAHQTPFSYALCERHDWPHDTISVRDLGDELRVETPALRIRVAKSPLRLHVETPDGRPVLSDTAGAGWAEVSDDTAPGGSRTEVRCWKSLVPDARFFGLGDKTFDLDRRGRKLTFWNSDTFAYAPEQDPIYKSIPFALTLAPQTPADGGDAAWTGGGLFLDNTFRAEMDLGVDAHGDADWWFGAQDGELRYYVFAPGADGDALKHPLKRYCDLTGHKPMPAKWSLGYHQSRWNYHDAGYALWIAHEFRRRGIPLDCVHLDIGHMDGYRVFTWDDHAFPDPAAMNEDLRALGVRSVVIVDPGVKVDEGYYAYREGVAGELFCENPDGSFFTDTVWPGNVHWPDFSKPEARSWWGEQHRRYLDSGVTGFWNDMNEPAILGGRDFPDDVRFAYGDRGTGPTDHREGHNVYGLLMAKATFDGLTADVRPDERPFLLTRACFSGSQRYAAAWTGDNVSTWEHLLLSVQICQSLSASGMAFCGPDIGGFAGEPSPELYARWMQAGVLYPFMRTHYSHEEVEQQEPWSFGPETEAVSKAAIELRYRLMPTIYSAFASCTETAEPPMKALFLEHPEDPETHHGCDDQCYLGPGLMAAPVVTEGARERSVYFPAGAWTDFWTGAAIPDGYAGTVGRRLSVDAPLHHLPLFIRGGRAVAMDPLMQHTDEFEPETLTLRLAPGAGTSTFTFDDGISYAYQRGDRLHLTVEQAEGSLRVSRDGERGLPYRRFEIQLPAATATTARADGADLPALAADAFEDADEGVLADGPWLRIRTRTDVETITWA